MMAKFADRLQCAPEMSDFLSECPVAAASLQLDWSLIEAKPLVGQALILGSYSHLVRMPSPEEKPFPPESPNPNQQVGMMLCDLGDEEGKGSSRSRMFIKPRADGPFLLCSGHVHEAFT